MGPLIILAEEEGPVIEEEAAAAGEAIVAETQVLAEEAKVAGQAIANEAEVLAGEAEAEGKAILDKIGQALSNNEVEETTAQCEELMGEAAEGGGLEAEGPGQWREAQESMSDRAADFQSKVTGQPPGRVYDVDGVKFDGYKDGKLLDAKGPGYEQFVDSNGDFKPWYRGAGELVDQAERQLSVAGDTPIEWHVAEEPAADAMRSLLQREGFGQIDVVFDPLQ